MLVRSENIRSEEIPQSRCKFLHDQHCIAMKIDIGFFVNPTTLMLLCGIYIISKNIMKIVKRTFKIGQCVYAKVKFYPAWPALISEIKGSSARVQFFGWMNQWYVF